MTATLTAAPLSDVEVAQLRAVLDRINNPPPAVSPRAGGFIVDQAPGQLATSAWANVIRDSAVVHFASIAERDTYWPAATAPLGAVCTTDADGGLWHLTTATGARKWCPPWATAWGKIATSIPTTTSNITAATVVGGMTATFTAIAGRSYRVVGECELAKDATAGNVYLTLTNAAGAQLSGAFANHSLIANMVTYGHVETLITGTGSTTVQARLQSTAGTVNVTGTRGLFAVHDAGPNVTIVP